MKIVYFLSFYFAGMSSMFQGQRAAYVHIDEFEVHILKTNPPSYSMLNGTYYIDQVFFGNKAIKRKFLSEYYY